MKLRNILSKELFFSFSLHLTSRSCICICRQFWAFCAGVAENSVLLAHSDCWRWTHHLACKRLDLISRWRSVVSWKNEIRNSGSCLCKSKYGCTSVLEAASFLLRRKLCRVRTHKRISYGMCGSVWWHLHTKEFACEEFKRCCSSHPYRAQVLSIPRKLSKTDDKTLRRGKGRSFLQRNISSWAVLYIDEARGHHNLMEQFLCSHCVWSNYNGKFWGIRSS